MNCHRNSANLKSGQVSYEELNQNKEITLKFQLLGVVTYNCDGIKTRNEVRREEFQLLGVVTYNCDLKSQEAQLKTMKFQLLGVVTYNCDLCIVHLLGVPTLVSVIRSSNL